MELLYPILIHVDRIFSTQKQWFFQLEKSPSHPKDDYHAIIYIYVRLITELKKKLWCTSGKQRPKMKERLDRYQCPVKTFSSIIRLFVTLRFILFWSVIRKSQRCICSVSGFVRILICLVFFSHIMGDSRLVPTLFMYATVLPFILFASSSLSRVLTARLFVWLMKSDRQLRRVLYD